METSSRYPEDQNKSHKELYEEYRNKFWKKHHEYKKLESKYYELETKISIYENTEYYGKITKVSHKNDYGFITYPENEDPIFFHVSRCNIKLDSSCVGERVKFKIHIGSKTEAIDVSLIMNPSKNIKSDKNIKSEAFKNLNCYMK